MKKAVFLILMFLGSEQSFSQTFSNIDLNAKSKIDSLFNLIKSGKNFDSLAVIYSEDFSSSFNDGKLPYYTIDIFEETFTYYLKNLKIGEVSKPFETIFGWYIIKLLDIDSSKRYLVQSILIKN